MSESERRRNYRYDRILIDTDRVLTPQFDDAVVYLTGSQVEMLRNVTQYLRRLETYVTEYNPGYYLTPTAEDYDAILAIVSELEEKLMGNPNTLWGYDDRLYQRLYENNAPAGTYDRDMDVVPAGEVWRVESALAYNKTSICSDIEVNVQLSGTDMELNRQATPAVNERVSWHGMLTLKEGDYVTFTWNGCTVGDDLECQIRGYKMVVPT